MRLLIGNKNYSTWSLRPWLVLTHFAIPFDEEFLPLSGDRWKQNLMAKTPTGQVPVLVDGSLEISETIAIIEYLADTNPQKPIWPTDVASRALARSASAEMHAGFTQLRAEAPMNLRATTLQGRVSIDDVKSDMNRLERLWVELILRSGGPFLFGPFSAADAMFAPVATRIRTYDIPASPTSLEYVESIHTLPAFVEWREAALQEPWIVEQDEIDYIQGKAT